MYRDRKLVDRLKQGDKNALQTLYLEHKDYMLTLANALLHDIALAEDVVHDVFVTFIRNIADFKLTGSLKGYFSICVANAARSLLRKQKSHAQSSDFTVEPQARDASCPLESAEIAEHVRNSLANLPDEQREVVVLHVKAGLKFREIARIQQVSLSTVQGRYRYGMDKLRSYLNGELEK